jgi:chromosome partitioning protein
MELDAKSRSTAEIEALWTYICDRLEKNFRRTVFSVPSGAGQRPAAGGFGRRIMV